MKEDLKLTKEWDKVFPKSEKVDHKKVTFLNGFGITLAGDLYKPKDKKGKLPAVAVSGPYGAVKEQASGLYAQKMAEKGFLTLAFDPSFTGESGGKPRYISSPDINTEDFQAAVDFLSTNEDVDKEKIGIIGICGWGSLALNAASIDPRIKATVSSTMYNISRYCAYGYFDKINVDERYEIKKNLSNQRIEDFKKGEHKLAGGIPDKLPDDAPFFLKDYFDYYKTKRGYHPRSLNSNQGWNVTGALSYMNSKMLAFTDEIRNAVLVIHGEKAHSCYFSKDAFKNLKGDNKELMIIPGAVHTDLYDKVDIIPFDKMVEFFNKYLK